MPETDITHAASGLLGRPQLLKGHAGGDPPLSSSASATPRLELTQRSGGGWALVVRAHRGKLRYQPTRAVCDA
eukprot:2288027-Rhodomonas_salina.4